MNFTAEQVHLFYQVTATILSTVGLGFLGLVWQFVKAVNEVPRMKKGLRILFEKTESLEKKVGELEKLEASKKRV